MLVCAGCCTAKDANLQKKEKKKILVGLSKGFGQGEIKKKQPKQQNEHSTKEKPKNNRQNSAQPLYLKPV